jgi:hypothetical protein
MRIISHIHDYYDSVMRMDEDRELIYLRREKYVDKAAYRFPICGGADVVASRIESKWMHVEDYTLGFCGKIYGVLKLVKKHRINSPNEVVAFCYNIDEADAFIKTHFKEEQVEIYLGKHDNWSWRRIQSKWTYHHNRKMFVKFFSDIEEKKNKYEKLFLDNEAPIFVAKHGGAHGVTWNAMLKPFEFYRIMEPYTAYQEISMYLGGLAAPQKKMPDISDEDMRDIKGFDKWSFRKPPNK